MWATHERSRSHKAGDAMCACDCALFKEFAGIGHPNGLALVVHHGVDVFFRLTHFFWAVRRLFTIILKHSVKSSKKKLNSHLISTLELGNFTETL